MASKLTGNRGHIDACTVVWGQVKSSKGLPPPPSPSTPKHPNWFPEHIGHRKMELNVFCDPTSWPPTFDGKPYTETQVEQDSSISSQVPIILTVRHWK